MHLRLLRARCERPRRRAAEQDIAARERETGTWPRGTLAQFCDHLDYLAAKIGNDHVGIGSDFFGGPQGHGLEDASCFPGIFAELIRRKWSRRNLRKLASGNFVRVLREAERSARYLSAFVARELSPKRPSRA